MIKRILVALDPDQDTPIAMRYAFRLAKRFDAVVTGLAVMDLRNISVKAGAGGWGTAGLYTGQVWDDLSDSAIKVAEKLLNNFNKSAEKKGIRYTPMTKRGASGETIIEESKYQDLIVMGRDSHFFYDEPGIETKTIAEVIKGSHAPALIVTDSYSDVEKVLAAFDGSSASSRSLKSFVHLLPYGKDIEIELLYVPEKESESEHEKADYVLGMAEKYLHDHNFNYLFKRVARHGAPAVKIMERLQVFNPDMILMGAHSVSAVQRLTFGSTTHELVTESPKPLFLTP